MSLVIFGVILLAGVWLFTQTSFGGDLYADLRRQLVNGVRDFMETLTSWARS